MKGFDPRRLNPDAIFEPHEVEYFKKHGIYPTMWNGFVVLEGPGYSKNFIDQVAARLNDTKSVIISVTGDAGEGKSWWALRLAEIFDPDFNPEIQMCFSTTDILKIISGRIKLKHGQAVIIDEAQIAMGSKTWQKGDQKELIKMLQTVRHRGLLILIVVLRADLLDKGIRDYMLNYNVFVEHAGYGVPYYIYMPRFGGRVKTPRLDAVELLPPGAEEECECTDCLVCKYVDECQVLRAQYERAKLKYVQSQSEEALEKIEEREAPRVKQKDLVDILYKHKDKIMRNKFGTIDRAWIIMILENEGHYIDAGTAGVLGKQLSMYYEDIPAKYRPPKE